MERACILPASVDCPTSPYYISPEIPWYQHEWVIPTIMISILVVAFAILVAVLAKKR